VLANQKMSATSSPRKKAPVSSFIPASPPSSAGAAAASSSSSSPVAENKKQQKKTGAEDAVTKPKVELQPKLTASGEIERLPKPDKAAHEKEILQIQNEIKMLQDRTNSIRKELDAIQSGRTGYGDQIQQVKSEYNQLRAEKDKLVAQRNGITAEMKILLEKKENKTKEQRSLRSSLKFLSVEEINQEILKLRHQQETRSMTLNEEKKIIKEIENLQKSKEMVDKFRDEKNELDQFYEKIKEIKNLQTHKNTEIDFIQSKMTVKKQELDALYELNQKQQQKDQFPLLLDERKQIKQKIDTCFQQIRLLRLQFKEQNDQYYVNVRAMREKKRLEKEQEEKRLKEEYEAKLAEYEKEMAKIHPYQDEMDLCDALVGYIEKMYGNNSMNKENKLQQDEEKEGEILILDGLKPLQRKEEDFISFGGGKKTGKKNKPPKHKKETIKLLALPLAQTEAFISISVPRPSTVAGLLDTIPIIKEKKKWFEKQTTRAPASASADKKKKNTTSTNTTPPTTSTTNSSGNTTSIASSSKTSSPKKKGQVAANNNDTNAFPTLGKGPQTTLPPAPPGLSAWGPGIGGTTTTTTAPPTASSPTSIDSLLP
jgi:uncharacterized coiled-coil DUF342 family protein